ncbi:cytochrome P450 [Trichoderma chlorosporum]
MSYFAIFCVKMIKINTLLGQASGFTVLAYLFIREYGLSRVSQSGILLVVMASSFYALLCFRILCLKSSSKLKHLPGPKSKSLILDNYDVIFSQPLGASMSTWMAGIPNNGLLHFYGLLGTEFVAVTSVEGITDVLTRRAYDFEKGFKFRQWAKRRIGHGLICDQGDVHRRNRKLVSPAFQAKRLSQLKPLMSSKAEQLSRNLCKLPRINVFDLASRYALDVACLVAMGTDFDLVSDATDPLFVAYHRAFSLNDAKVKSYMLNQLLPAWLFPLLASKEDEQMTKGYASFQAIVEKILQERLEGKEAPAIADSVLDQLIRSKEFSREDCVGQILFILSAGFETTASTASWIMSELAFDQELQSLLRRELETCGDPEDAQWDEKLDALPLLSAVCNETIRVRPVVSHFIKKAVRDTVICGQSIPKGTNVVLIPEATNKSTQFWGHDAQDFRPQRWLNEEHGLDMLGGAPSNYCMGTFSNGPRGCIGRAVAILKIKRFTAALVRRYQIVPADPVRPIGIGAFTVQPKDFGVHLLPLDTHTRLGYSLAS